MGGKVLLALIVLVLAGCAKPMQHLAAAQPKPVATRVSGEQTQPLVIRTAAPIDPPRALPLPVAKFALAPEFDVTPDAASNGVAYYQGAGTVAAFDLSRGAVRWRRAADIDPGSIVASPDGVAFSQRYPKPWLYLDARSGEQRLALNRTTAAGSLDGLLFAKNDLKSSYFAIDAQTGEKIWGTYGGGMQVAGPPQIRHGLLLQLFVNDGAIIEDALYAFDPANGHAKWNAFSNAQPLGFRGDVMYVDSTWFPEQLDNYVPLTVAAIDMRDGKKLDEYTYAPDPLQNAATYRNTPVKAYVSGGFVYLEVNGTWYRYDADRPARAAHPSRLANLDVADAFDGGTLLLDDARHSYIGAGARSAMTLRELPGGALAAPVARDAAGESYAVAGSILYRFDTRGAPRAIGRVACGSVQAVLPWPGKVAVMCARRELLFDLER